MKILNGFCRKIPEWCSGAAKGYYILVSLEMLLNRLNGNCRDTRQIWG